MAIKNYNSTPFQETAVSCTLGIYNTKNKYHIHTVNRVARFQTDSDDIKDLDEICYNQFIESIRALEYNCNFIENLNKFEKVNTINLNESTLEEVETFKNALFNNLEILKNLSKRENKFTYNIDALKACKTEILKTPHISASTPSQRELIGILKISKDIAIQYYLLIRDMLAKLIKRGKIENLNENYEKLVNRLKFLVKRTNILIELLDNNEISLDNLNNTLNSQDLYKTIMQSETKHSI